MADTTIADYAGNPQSIWIDQGGTGYSRLVSTFRFITVELTPTLDTSAYAALDSLHTADLELTNMAKVAGGYGAITRMTVVDKADQGAAGFLHLFDTTTAAHTFNTPFAPSDAEAATLVLSIPIGTYVDFDTSKVATTANARYVYKCAAGSTSLFGVLQTTGTPTYAASSLVIRIQAEVY